MCDLHLLTGYGYPTQAEKCLGLYELKVTLDECQNEKNYRNT